jgi:hypothetical protein
MARSGPAPRRGGRRAGPRTCGVGERWPWGRAARDRRGLSGRTVSDRRCRGVAALQPRCTRARRRVHAVFIEPPQASAGAVPPSIVCPTRHPPRGPRRGAVLRVGRSRTARSPSDGLRQAYGFMRTSCPVAFQTGGLHEAHGYTR